VPRYWKEGCFCHKACHWQVHINFTNTYIRRHKTEVSSCAQDVFWSVCFVDPPDSGNLRPRPRTQRTRNGFLCSITMMLMKDPVVATSTVSFWKHSMYKHKNNHYTIWLARSHHKQIKFYWRLVYIPRCWPWCCLF
jgi:hypothetical protein